MSRFQGFHRKVNRRIQNLEHFLGVGSVADAMRVLALMGEWPANPILRQQVGMMKDMAGLMAKTIPPPRPEPKEEAKEDFPLSETFAQETVVAGTPDNSIKAVRIGPGEYVKVH
jgi:hypothetical protein